MGIKIPFLKKVEVPLFKIDNFQIDNFHPMLELIRNCCVVVSGTNAALQKIDDKNKCHLRSIEDDWEISQDVSHNN